VINPFQQRTSVVKKSVAISPSQWAFKNWRQVVFLLRLAQVE
jgi:hypothetical protein